MTNEEVTNLWKEVAEAIRQETASDSPYGEFLSFSEKIASGSLLGIRGILKVLCEIALRLPEQKQ